MCLTDSNKRVLQTDLSLSSACTDVVFSCVFLSIKLPEFKYTRNGCDSVGNSEKSLAHPEIDDSSFRCYEPLNSN